jgi:hypothetical protein
MYLPASMGRTSAALSCAGLSSAQASPGAAARASAVPSAMIKMKMPVA